MSTYTENKGQLVINLMDLSIFQDLVSKNQIGLNELYLIRGENTDEVLEVKYLAGSQKFVYTTVDGNQVDIVTLAGLKTLLSLATVASSGNYTDLNNKPSINGVVLAGDKSTSDLNVSLDYSTDSITNKPSINGVTLTGNLTTNLLNISYDDLTNKPAIPAVSSTYVPGNTGAALTSKGVEGALENYVPNSRTVTGTGALEGGGSLSNNLTISHKTAPVGLNTAAIKVGVDEYGHVCTGDPITASDVSAVPLKPSSATSIGNLDGSSSAILVLGSQSETLGFSTAPEPGKKLIVRYVNTSNSNVDITIPSNLTTGTFVNNVFISESYGQLVEPGKSVELGILFFSDAGNTYSFINIT